MENNMNCKKIINVRSPLTGTDVVNKLYVDQELDSIQKKTFNTPRCSQT